MVNQPHVLAFTQLLAPAFEREFGGRLETTAVPYDQLTSQQILDVQGGPGSSTCSTTSTSASALSSTPVRSSISRISSAPPIPRISCPRSTTPTRCWTAVATACRSTATYPSSTTTARSSRPTLPTPLQIGFDQANSAFLSGQAAMLDTRTDLGLKAQDPASSKIVDKWGVVPLPVGGSNTEHRTAMNARFGLGVSTAAGTTRAGVAPRPTMATTSSTRRTRRSRYTHDLMG
jgi:hypothetical protein